jgi:mono/diheme cytochrome c family protein
MRFLSGLVVGVVGVLVAGFLLANGGKMNLAATQHGGWNDRLDHWLSRVSRRSIEKHASSSTNPYAADPGAAAAGLAHYRENCLACHGARDVDTAEFAKGLNPGPPMLDMDDVQKMSDGELFWVVANGLRATGMPAFAPTHSPREIWQIVSFVRHLPRLSEAEASALKKGQPDEAAHHDEDHPDAEKAPADSKPPAR